MKGGALYANIVESAMGGGIYVNNGSFFSFSDGSIYSNQATTGGGIYASKQTTNVEISGGFIFSNTSTATGSSLGGGIRNNESTMELTGGKIGCDTSGSKAGNRSPNGEIPGYSSEIFNNGYLKITDGTIYLNQAASYPFVNKGTLHFLNGYVEGTGLAGILNRDQMLLEGGNIDNDGDYGIYAQSGMLHIRNGEAKGRTYDLYGAGGNIYIEKSPKISTIYLRKGIHIEVPDVLSGDIIRMIRPEDYTIGRLLVKVTYPNGNAKAVRSQFELSPYQNYYMYDEGTGLYVGEKAYQVDFHPNGGSGTMDSAIIQSGNETKLPKNKFAKKGYQFVGWSRKAVNPGSKKEAEWKD
jgi:hypothetical protein